MKSFEANLGVKLAGKLYRTTVEFEWREEWEEFISWPRTVKRIKETYQEYRIAGLSRQCALDQAAEDVQDRLYEEEEAIWLRTSCELKG